MFFNKYPYRANFTFAEGKDGTYRAGKRELWAEVQAYEGGVYHVRVAGSWEANLSIAELTPPAEAQGSRLTIDDSLGLTLLGKDGTPLLQGVPNQGFGVSGEASIWQLLPGPGARFYGMGEKTFGRVELSGLRTRFWNTDVWGDFDPGQWGDRPTDPPYASVPYVVVRQGDEYVGLLLHTSYPAFFETPGNDESRVFVEWQRTAPFLILGADGGEPNLWVVYGPTLQEVTQKLQKLIGTVPTPPLWSLGYHQSRWGYGGDKDLADLDEKFAKHAIPCDGLWLDLDYMDGYRIFTVDEAMFPEGTIPTAERLALNGRRMVPILDPGLKKEGGYGTYDDAKEADILCQNVEGEEYVGLVWPGETVFPDFSLPEARDWWSAKVAEFAKGGFGAVWCDMNDPSTGPVDPHGMLFGRGSETHASRRNEYAFGMVRATHDGFLWARPDERPFVLTRSASTGSARYAAVWTGDNVANRFYLANSIPCCLGMSISGLPFCGPDLGGFGGVADEALMIDWTKANFLFPFLRNHADRGAGRKEPWAFSKGLNVLRRYIRLRYKLLPYLYNLFAEGESIGDPTLRPLFYHFDEEGLDTIHDQFMVGPSLLQAPFLDEASKSRTVRLPGDEPWYDASNGDWIAPGETTVRRGRETTPLYVRTGAVIPMRPGTPVDSRHDLREVNLHVFVPEDWNGETRFEYVADDGLSYGYRRGERTTLSVDIVSASGHLAISTSQSGGYGEINPRFVFHGPAKSVRIDSAEVALADESITLTGRPLKVRVTL